MARNWAVVAALLVSVPFVLGQNGCGTETRDEPDPPGADSEPGERGGDQAGLGDAITLEGHDTTMAITVLEVLDPMPTGEFDEPSGNHRFVGVQMQMRNVGDSTYRDSPSNGAAIITNRDQQADPAIVSEGPCGGQFAHQTTVSPGSQRRGCIPFEVPGNQQPAVFQFALDSGFGPETGEWRLR